jgi:hypothetical protein
MVCNKKLPVVFDKILPGNTMNIERFFLHIGCTYNRVSKYMNLVLDRDFVAEV